MPTLKKQCRICGEKNLSKLKREVKDGVTRILRICRCCENYNITQYRHKMRTESEKIPQVILQDCRNYDRKKGFKNDMTREFIEELIAPGCTYCEDTELRMTLDRIDNSRGHTQDNVVAACIRCNYVRKTMPYQAWLLVAKRMKSARIKGLFGDWTGRAR